MVLQVHVYTKTSAVDVRAQNYLVDPERFESSVGFYRHTRTEDNNSREQTKDVIEKNH